MATIGPEELSARSLLSSHQVPPWQSPCPVYITLYTHSTDSLYYMITLYTHYNIMYYIITLYTHYISYDHPVGASQPGPRQAALHR